MRNQNKTAYCNLVDLCICGIAVLLVPVMASGRDDPPVCETKGTTVIVENGEDPLQECPWKVIDRIAESGKRRQSEIRREIQDRGISSGRAATAYLANLAVSRRGLDRRSWRIRVRICLELLQCMPDAESVVVLRKLAESEAHSDATRTEVFYTMCLQTGGSAYVEQHLESRDDKIRGAAIRALSRVQSNEQVRSMIQIIRAQEGDLTGTYTGNALSEAQNMLDHSESLSAAADFGDKLRSLLVRLPYEAMPIPTGPVLGTGPDSAFVWEQLRSLWHEDTALARRIIEEYREANPEKEGLIELLLDDLSGGTCPPLEPKPRRSSGEEATGDGR